MKIDKEREQMFHSGFLRFSLIINKKIIALIELENYAIISKRNDGVILCLSGF